MKFLSEGIRPSGQHPTSTRHSVFVERLQIEQKVRRALPCISNLMETVEQA
jgi:hypothetical protein